MIMRPAGLEFMQMCSCIIYHAIRARLKMTNRKGRCGNGAVCIVCVAFSEHKLVLPTKREITFILRRSPPANKQIKDERRLQSTTLHLCVFPCVCVKCSMSHADLRTCICVQALDALGLKPSEAQQQIIRTRLRADPDGTVAFTGETPSAPGLLLSTWFALRLPICFAAKVKINSPQSTFSLSIFIS